MGVSSRRCRKIETSLNDLFPGHERCASIVLLELWYGIAKNQRRAENIERLRVFLSGGIGVVSFEADDARKAGELRAELHAAGTPIGPYDVLIAAQALRSGATLVTSNVGEFSRVRDLAWQDWSVPSHS